MTDPQAKPFNSDVAFSPSVKRAQAARGSRDAFERRMERRDWPDRISEDLAAFIAERDSFYLATASAAGQPYIQHRGGPKGFLKVLDDRTLGFADFSGNRQYISTGNVDENDKAFIFLMDYMNRRRVKLWGRLRVVEDDPQRITDLMPKDYDARAERAFLFTLSAWDVNCSQHIPEKFDRDIVEPATEKLVRRIELLEAEITRLRGQSGGGSGPGA